MPRPPLVDDGEVERPDPGLGAQVWHQQVMVTAATNHKAICHSIQHACHQETYLSENCRGALPVYQGAVASGRQVPVVLDGTLEVFRVRQISVVAPHPLVHCSLISLVIGLL
jgi:hypothetical protein